MFRTTPAVVEALLRAREYERDPDRDRSGEGPYEYIGLLSLDWPHPNTWKNVETYWHQDVSEGDPIVYWLITVGKLERVLFIYASS